MTTVFLHPKQPSESNLNSGIARVVYTMYQRLPELGVTFVDDLSNADVYAVHVVDDTRRRRQIDVLHCHGLYPTGEIQADRWMWEVNSRVIAGARQAHIVTVPSRWVGEIFARNMGFFPRVIPHGIDLRVWPKRKDYTSPPVVLWNKNRPEDVCDPTPVNEIARIARDVQFLSTFGEVQDNVVVTGPVSHAEMKKMLYSCGIYLATTKETFGIGILEALAAGLPVVGWSWGAIRDIIEDGVDGFLVDPGDFEGTAKAIHNVIEDYDRLRSNTRKKASHFSWKAAMELYRQCYKDSVVLAEEEAEGLVSVIIPCYNYAQWVSEAIESVRKQTYNKWECIVVDDGSTDDSLNVIRETIGNDPRFRVIAQENSGVAAARNNGAMAARGAFLTFLDADDRLCPNFMEELVHPLLRNRSLGIVYGKLALMGPDGTVTVPQSDWPGEDFSAKKQLKRKNRIPACNMMRREAFLRTGGYRQHTAPTEDAELWSRFPLIGYDAKLATGHTVYEYRVHNNSASAAVRGKKEPDWLAWLPSVYGGEIPFAATISPERKYPSHPVRNYDCPKASVIIPVGDGHEKFLQDAIESVAAQTDPRWELIVVDDTTEGGIENYGSVPYKVAYPWIRWMRNDCLHNVSAARNLGASIARGRYLCFLDADDYLYRDFLYITLEVASQCPEEDPRILYTDWVSLPDRKVHSAAEWDVHRLLGAALFAVTNLLPKAAFDEVGGFDTNIPLWEDWDLILNLAVHGFYGEHIKKPLFAYRYNTGRRREDSLKDSNALLKIIANKYKGVSIMPRRH